MSSWPVDLPSDGAPAPTAGRAGSAADGMRQGVGWSSDPRDPSIVRWWDGDQFATDSRDPVPSSASPSAEHWTLAEGWYDDPMDGGQVRWWDGSGWTEHVRPRSDGGGMPAGWYADPLGSAGQRWWDGGAWTTHVHVDEQPASPVAGWYPDPVGGEGQRWWDGGAWTVDVTGAALAAVPVEPSPSRVPDLVAARREVPASAALPAIAVAASAAAEPSAAPGALTADETLPEAGWYPDPVDPSLARWWDGAGWSAQVDEAPRVSAPDEHSVSDIASAAGVAVLAAAAVGLGAHAADAGTPQTPEGVEPLSRATEPAAEVPGPSVSVEADDSLASGSPLDAESPAIVGPEPGWYPDPSTWNLARWWDGTAWSAASVPLALLVHAAEGGVPAVSAPPARRPGLTLPAWAWALLAVSLVLWFLAWQAAQPGDEPRAPQVVVAETPAAGAAADGGAQPAPSSPLPSLTPAPLDGAAPAAPGR